MLSLEGRQAKMEISEEFIEVYIVPLVYLCDFFFQGLCLLHNSSRIQCHMPNASCSLQEKVNSSSCVV